MARKNLGPGGRPPVEGEALDHRVTVYFSSSDMKDLEFLLAHHDPSPFKSPTNSTAVRFAVRKMAADLRSSKR